MVALIISVASAPSAKVKVIAPSWLLENNQVLRKIVSQHFKKPILSIAMAPNLMYGLPKTINWLSIMTLSIR